MKLDLRKDRKSLLKYIKARVRAYPVYVDAGPGEDEDPITQITFGYQFDQAGWAAMVFDTRPDPAVDGVWQNCIEENELEFPHWCKAYQALCEAGKAVELIRLDGNAVTLDPEEGLAESLGVFLRDLLVACRDDGLFDNLPRASCKLTVEEHEGQYGWTEIGGDDDAETESGDPFAVSDALRDQAAAMSRPKQVSFWVARLKQIAAETKRDPEDYEYSVDSNVNGLSEIGNESVVPMLKLAVDLAGPVTVRGRRRWGPRTLPIVGAGAADSQS